MRFWPEPVPYSFIEPELSSTSATSSVFFRRISLLAAKLISVGLVVRLAEQAGKDGRK